MKVNKTIVDNRRNDIMKMIQEDNYVSVNDLAEKFNVSAITVRRDLQYWEDQGAIIRNYGGAALIQEFIEDADYDNKRYLDAIAKKAAQFVRDDDVIFINSSKTALRVIDHIKNKRVTIITNNAKAINYTPDPSVTIVFTGGEVRFPKNSMTGDFALNTLNNITANKCFIGCSGLTEEGISTELMKEMLINKTMLQKTRGQRFVLCDHNKIGLNYSFVYSNLEDVSYIITDVKANMEILDRVKERTKVDIIKVEPIGKSNI